MSKNIPKIQPGFKNIKKLLLALKTKPEEFWIEKGEARALKLFKLMSERVPAYKDFLRKNKVNPDLIRSIEDFKKIPTIDKYNYLKVYPLEKLCWDGELKERRWTISTTSGSTGEPFYFPREVEQDWQYAIYADLYFRTNFQVDKKSTLYVVGFPMGAWIGGVFTFETIRLLAQARGYKLSVITPGIHKEEIIKAVRNLGDKFDQVIIGCYGPFLKDTLDDGEKMGFRWKDYNLKFIFSAEAFSEGFRDYVLKIAGIKGNDVYCATLNHYGTVDLGTMSYETPLAILARRIAVKRKRIYKKLFGDTIKLPTFTQYIPELFYFEEVSDGLVCSAFSGLPLVRYDLKDHGGVLTFGQVLKNFSEEGIDLLASAKNVGIINTVWKIPFVHVYERKDFSISFYAFQIYPETIRKALQRRELARALTGKFTMMTKYDFAQNQYIEINIEMKAEVRRSKGLEEKVQKAVVAGLLKESSEYRETFGNIGQRALPKIILWPYEYPRYFKPGTKQKWVINK